MTSGVGGMLSMQANQKAAPDGYTLGYVSGGEYAKAVFSHTLPLDVRKSFQPVVQVITNPVYMTFSMKAPFATLQEMIAYARKNPGAISYGHGGVGGSS